nr:flagellin [uncultured Acetatifactor sp.]
MNANRMANYQILAQAGQAMLAQSNQSNKGVLSLL